MNCEWTLVTGPVQEPISIAEAKGQARISHSTEDGVLFGFIKAAREAGELYMGRGFFTQTWKYTQDDFADVMSLPMAAPLQSVTSVQYYDGDGVLQALSASAYLVDTTSRPGRILRAPETCWPSVQCDRPGGVIVTYVVGWSTLAAIPERIKHGIRMYVAYLDADRDGAGVEGNPQSGDIARRAAEACWSDRVEWIPPQ